MSHVEVLATGIKIESKQSKALLGGRSRDQELLKINQSRAHSCNLTFDPLKIKRSRASVGNNQAIFADQKPKA